MTRALLNDMATAAAFACNGYFTPETIVEDILSELAVGDTLDCDQIPTFLKVLGGEIEVDDRYEAIEADYDVSGIGSKFDRHESVHDVYWD